VILRDRWVSTTTYGWVSAGIHRDLMAPPPSKKRIDGTRRDSTDARNVSQKAAGSGPAERATESVGLQVNRRPATPFLVDRLFLYHGPYHNQISNARKSPGRVSGERTGEISIGGRSGRLLSKSASCSVRLLTLGIRPVSGGARTLILVLGTAAQHGQYAEVVRGPDASHGLRPDEPDV
jgi:hypothetical protein